MGVRVGPTLPDNLLFTYLPSIKNNRLVNHQNDITMTGDYNGLSLNGKRQEPDLEYYGGPVFQIDTSISVDTTKPLYISLWVRIDDFGSHEGTNEDHIRYQRKAVNKRTYIAEFHTGQFVMSIGAMGPHFEYDNSTNYGYRRDPFSFVISNYITESLGRQHYSSVYTDYKFYLKTWYFLTIEITPDIENYANVKVYVNNILEPVIFHQSKILTRVSRYKIIKTSNELYPQHGVKYHRPSFRARGDIAVGPNFLNKYGEIPGPIQNNVLIFGMKYNHINQIRVSPIRLINKPWLVNTHIDIGQMYIYQNELNTKKYYNNYNVLNDSKLRITKIVYTFITIQKYSRSFYAIILYFNYGLSYARFEQDDIVIYVDGVNGTDIYRKENYSSIAGNTITVAVEELPSMGTFNTVTFSYEATEETSIVMSTDGKILEEITNFPIIYNL